MKIKKENVSRCSRLPESAIFAAILICLTPSVGYANPADRISRRIDDFNPRTMNRAERRELRQSLRSNPDLARTFNYAGAHLVQTSVPLSLLPSVSNNPIARASVTRNSQIVGEAGPGRSLNGLSFDLSDTVAGITVGSDAVNNGTVTIEVGGVSKVIGAGSKVTVAEFAALSQKLTTGYQGLVLNSQGTASGGELNINVVSDNGKTIRASEFVVPEKVTVAGDFGRRADGLRVTNDLTNYGSIYAVSTNQDKSKASIAARDINNAGGLISTNTPESIAAQFGATNKAVDLSLRADRNFDNTGQIVSSGSLEISAGNSLRNTSNIQANGNVVLTTANLVNSGLVASANANVKVDAPVDTSLLIEATGGEFRALNGNIEIATNPDSINKTNTTLVGGNWHAKHLNIESGDGAVAANVADVTAEVSITGGSAQFNSTGDLILGSLNVSGDPLISSDGNVVINASIITNGEPLSIIAGANITCADGITIDTSLSGGTGGAITIVAGAAFTVPDDLEITGGSGPGGNVDLTGVTALQSGSDTTTNGGNIQIVAFGGLGTGFVNLTGVPVMTGGSGAGTNGNFTVMAAADSGNAIVVDEIVTTGGSGNVAKVNLSVVDPGVSPKIVIEIAAGPTQGQVNSGAFTSGPIRGGDIVMGGILVTSDLTVLSGGNLQADVVGVVAQPNDDGGSISIDVFNILGNVPISLSANGTNLGDGGSISLTRRSDTDLNIGTNLLFFATGGGDGGTIDVSSAGSIFVDTNGINASGTDGGSKYRFDAGSSLVFTGNLTATDGEIVLESNFKKVFLLGADTKPTKNGTFGSLSAGRIEVINHDGGIKLNDSGAINNTDEVALTAQGTRGGISSSDDAVLLATDVTLRTDNGAIGKKPFVIDAAVFEADSINGSVRLVNQRASLTILRESAASGSYELQTSGALTVDKLNVQGDIEITGGTGGILTVDDRIHAENGSITLINPDVTNGAIALLSNAVVETAGEKGGNTIISIGEPPKKPTNTTPPVNVATNIQGKGVAFFEGPAGGIVVATGVAFVNAIDKTVLISNGSDNAGVNKITLGNLSVVTADPPITASVETVALKAADVMPKTSVSAPSIPVLDQNMFGRIEPIAAQTALHDGVVYATTAQPQFANIAENHISLATSSPNDSYLVRYEPSQLSRDVHVCSDMDLSTALTSHSGDEDVAFVAHTDNMTVREGHLLFAPSRNTKVVTPKGLVFLEKDSVALIVCGHDHLSVYDINDQHKNSVRVEVEGNSISLSPGRHIAISSKAADSFCQINPIESVMHKAVRKHKVTNATAFVSDFSIHSAISTIKPLNAIVKSNHVDARKLAAQIIKTSAVVMQLDPNDAAFAYHVKPRTLAMNAMQ